MNGKSGIVIKLDKDHAVGIRLEIPGMSLILGSSVVGIDSLRKAEEIIKNVPEGTPEKEEALKEVRKFM